MLPLPPGLVSTSVTFWIMSARQSCSKAIFWPKPQGTDISKLFSRVGPPGLLTTFHPTSAAHPSSAVSFSSGVLIVSGLPAETELACLRAPSSLAAACSIALSSSSSSSSCTSSSGSGSGSGCDADAGWASPPVRVSRGRAESIGGKDTPADARASASAFFFFAFFFSASFFADFCFLCFLPPPPARTFAGTAAGTGSDVSRSAPSELSTANLAASAPACA